MEGTSKSLGQVPPSLGSKDLVFIRHGESIAEIFPNWVVLSKLEENYYNPFASNVPIKIPKRTQMKEAYTVDPPLSEAGIKNELIYGKTERISVIYSSPTLVSLQTAVAIQHLLGSPIVPIRIAPALCTDPVGKDFWMTASQLESEGCFDNSYIPQIDEVSEPSLEAVRSRMISFIRYTQEGENQIDGIALFVTDSLGIKVISNNATPTCCKTKIRNEIPDVNYFRFLRVYDLNVYDFPPLSSRVVILTAKPKKVYTEFRRKHTRTKTEPRTLNRLKERELKEKEAKGIVAPVQPEQSADVLPNKKKRKGLTQRARLRKKREARDAAEAIEMSV